VAFVVTTVVEDKDRRHNEIWMAPADGSAPAFRYTSPSTEASSPNWSPDGTLLSFSSRREGGEDDVWFLRTTPPGGEAFQIKGVRATPEFSRDGQWLLFAWRGEEPDSLKQQTWRQRVSPVAITRGADAKRFDGRVYTSIPIVADERGFLPPREIRRPSHLYVVPLAGGTPKQLTSGDLSQTSAAWSPDGKRIAFGAKREGDEQSQIYLLDLGGGEAQRITNLSTGAGSPSFSPDGTKLLFTSNVYPGALDDEANKKAAKDEKAEKKDEAGKKDGAEKDEAKKEPQKAEAGAKGDVEIEELTRLHVAGGERLLRVHVLAGLERARGDGGVGAVRGEVQDRVDARVGEELVDTDRLQPELFRARFGRPRHCIGKPPHIQDRKALCSLQIGA